MRQVGGQPRLGARLVMLSFSLPDSPGPGPCVARWPQAEGVILLQVIRVDQAREDQQPLWHSRCSALREAWHQGGTRLPGPGAQAVLLLNRPRCTPLGQSTLSPHGTIFKSSGLLGACISARGEGVTLAWALSLPLGFWLCSGLLCSSCLGWEWWHPALLLPPGAFRLSTVRTRCGPRGQLHCPFYPARTPRTRILVI